MNNRCKVCGGVLKQFIDFGKMPLANRFLKSNEFDKEYYFNLAVGLCPICHMVQLINQPNPNLMFNNEYPFFSSSSTIMKTHFSEMVDNVLGFIKPGDFVIEIGSNDGTMLSSFREKGCNVLGIEPSSNVAKVASLKDIPTIVDFFNEYTASYICSEYGKANAIIATNVMCHIPDLNSVLQGVYNLLEDNGVFVFEDPYIVDIIDNVSYDQIYDEHVFLFSISSIHKIISRNGMRLFMVSHQNVHGGSMRYYICKDNRPIHSSINKFINLENILGYNYIDIYNRFAIKVKESSFRFKSILEELKNCGENIVGYAATSKSTTILNYANIDNNLISCIYDTTPEKWYKYTPGTHIQIIPYSKFKKDNPRHSVLFAWNHKKEILEKEKWYSGKFIIPHENI